MRRCCVTCRTELVWTDHPDEGERASCPSCKTENVCTWLVIADTGGVHYAVHRFGGGMSCLSKAECAVAIARFRDEMIHLKVGMARKVITRIKFNKELPEWAGLRRAVQEIHDRLIL